MMMVMTVMAEDLHLFSSYGKYRVLSNDFLDRSCAGDRTGRQWMHWKIMRAGIRFAALPVAMLVLCLAGAAQYSDRDSSGAPKTSAHAPPPEARIDINHASVGELMRAPGMARPWAERIVRFRPYRTKQDLVDRGIVTSAVYDRIKDFIIAHREKQ